MPQLMPPWLRYERNDQARHQRDVPKRQRPQRVISPARPLLDARAVLGHDPRPRKARRRGR